METLQAIIEVATQQFGSEGATLDVDAPLTQLGVDSLGFLELLFELEDHVGVAIPPDAVNGVHSLRELATRIDELKAAPPPAPSDTSPDMVANAATVITSSTSDAGVQPPR